MRIVITLFFILLSMVSNAQYHYYGKTVTNDGSAIGYTNVILFDVNDSSFIAGTVSDSIGNFKLESSQSGDLKVSCVGYEDAFIKGKPDEEIIIPLKANMVQMHEVVVQSPRPITRIDGDALVTNIRGTVLGKLGNAMDVLGHLPGVMNEQGSIEVIGKGTPVFYINGREVRNINELEQLRSERIKKVEVVMNPGARYDATVKAVIRIMADRVQGEGFGFDSSTKLGYRDYLYGSEILNMNYRYNKLDVFANLEYARDKQKGESSNRQRTWLASRYNQDINIYSKGINQLYDGKLGFNYAFSPTRSFGLFYEITHEPKKSWSDYATKSWVDDLLEDESLIGHRTKSRTTTHDIDGYYIDSFGKWIFNASFDMLWKNGKSNEANNEINTNAVNRTINSTDNIHTRMLAGEVHLSHPLWKGKLNVGTEYSNTRRNEEFINIESVIDNNNPLVKENNIAVYLELMQKLGKVSFQIGTRYEHVTSNYYQKGIKVDEQSRSYNKLFPTASLSMPLGKMMMQLSYTKKYIRPVYSQLSSTINYVNRYLYQSGNPFLQPSYIDDYSLNVNYRWATVMASFIHTKDKIITSALQYQGNPDITLLQKVNSSYSMKELQVMLQISPEFQRYYPALLIGVVAPFYKEEYRGHIKSFNRPIWMIRFNNLFVLSPTTMLGANLKWRGRGNGENIESGQSWQIDASLRKRFNKHWSLSCNINDIFNTARKSSNTIYSNISELYMEKRINTRSIECTLRYDFNVTKSKYKGQGAGKEEKKRF